MTRAHYPAGYPAGIEAQQTREHELDEIADEIEIGCGCVGRGPVAERARSSFDRVDDELDE